jgi:hypothetical protein
MYHFFRIPQLFRFDRFGDVIIHPRCDTRPQRLTADIKTAVKYTMYARLMDCSIPISILKLKCSCCVASGLPPCNPLYFSLLRDLQSIVDLNSQISNRALQTTVTEQKLDCPQILGSSVYQGRFCTSHRVGTVSRWIKTDGANPLMHDSGVLPSGDMR